MCHVFVTTVLKGLRLQDTHVRMFTFDDCVIHYPDVVTKSSFYIS